MNKILILDFGSQVTQLIARRVRELEFYCEIVPYNKPIDYNAEISAVILSGSPCSVRDNNHPEVNINEIANHCPVLGICYGAQLMAQNMGGRVAASNKREYGRAILELTENDDLFSEVNNLSQVWMSHSDTIDHLDPAFTVIAKTESIPIAAFRLKSKKFPVYGVQFHPEVAHTLNGAKMISNFLFKICSLKPNWTTASFIDQSIESIKKEVGDDEVVLGLSGGVDSSVAALLMKKAIGPNLHCIFIDNGLLRKNEFEQVLQAYKDLGLDVRGVVAHQEFYEELKGLTDPELKRKAIGKVFIEVFQKSVSELPKVKWLCQGTIYPDRIESASVYGGPSSMIKSHHNVGGLPESLRLKIIEPLHLLFKDEVRHVGKALNLPPEILNRHPFPGPGLAIRIIGEINAQNVQLLQQADQIYIDHLKSSGWYDKIWQAGAILLPIHTVGVMGDERTYERVIALRAVHSTDGMTAEWSHIPHELLANISNDIINTVKGINRVVYDISTKPPATIEWE